MKVFILHALENTKRKLLSRWTLSFLWVLIFANFSFGQTAASDFPDIQLDAVESTSGWRSHNTVTLDKKEFKRDGASLQSVGSGKDRFRKKFASPIDVSNMRYLMFWYYVDDPKKLGIKGQIEIGSAGTYDTEEQNWSVYEQHLHKGWNYVVLDLPGSHRSKTNVPIDLTSINWFRIYHDPTASITTRIDDIRFTNRDPRSAAFSSFLETKRLSRDILQSSWLDSFNTLVYETDVNDPRRQQVCRKLKIEQAHREVSRYSLEKMGVAPIVVYQYLKNNDFIMHAVCGNATPDPDFLRRNMGNEVVLNRALMDMYDVSQEAAAEIQSRVLELDLSRIMEACGVDGQEIEDYITTGTVPGDVVGENVLFGNCNETSANGIALRLGSRDPFVNNRAFTFRQCMKDFTDQGSECSNPHMNADDDFKRRLKRLNLSKQMEEMHIRDMGILIREINATTLETLNRSREEHAQLAPTTADPNHPQYARLQGLHGEYDDLNAAAVSAGEIREVYGESASDLAWELRVLEEQYELERRRNEKGKEICEINPKDNICPGLPVDPPNARCAEMNIGGGNSVFYNKPPGASGFSQQLNEGDRINHCLCDLFDKDYSELPQFAMIGGSRVNGFCPDPMERVMHECTQPGWSDGPPSPECVMRGLVSDQVPETQLPTQVCWAMRSDECPNPALDDNGDCNCFKAPSGPVDIGPLLGRCANALRCLDGSNPTYINDLQGCGCAALDPVPNVCTNNILTRNDPIINYFPGVTALDDRPVVLLQRDDPMVTRAVSKSVLTDDSLNFSVFNAFNTGSVNGQAEARCTNLNTGVSNYLVDRVPVSNLDSGVVRNVGFAFSGADLDQCFGSQGDSRAHLELSVRTADSISRVGYVANDSLINILGPDMPQQPCVQPVGPVPRPWNLSGGDVIRTDLSTVFPIMSDGLIRLPFTVVEPVVFTRDYAPSSLDIFDNSSAPAVSTLNVTRQGPTGMLTLHLHLRGNWLAGRFLVTLTSPDGTEVHEVFGLGVPEEGEAEEEYDGGMILRLDELDYTIDSEGPWTLEVRDLGGSESGRKSGDLYSWSLNFNAVEDWSN